MTGEIPGGQTVYIATGGNVADGCFHTDPACESIKHVDKLREVRRGDRPELRCCRRCSGEWLENLSTEQSHPHDALAEMTPEEAGLSPLRTDREVGGS